MSTKKQKTKIEKLKQKGWVSGSAEEFLTDSNPDNNPDKVSEQFSQEMSQDHGDEIAKLRRERDEARREVCEMNSIESSNESVDFLSLTSQDIADERGWDCYASDTLSKDVEFYILQDAKLRKGLKQAKEGKFSKTPPKIKPTKKKKK